MKKDAVMVNPAYLLNAMAYEIIHKSIEGTRAT